LLVPVLLSLLFALTFKMKSYSLPYSHLLSIFSFIALATAAALKNITIALPEGTTDHGDPGLLCFPTGWTDLFTFYLGNYVAHAATVKFLPGEKVKDMIPTVVISLLFPAFGAFRGIISCLSGAVFVKKGDPFKMAVRARALCMVIRGINWTPAAGDEVRDVIIRHIPEEGKVVDTNGKYPESLHMAYTDILGTESLEGEIAISVFSTPWAWNTMAGDISANGREIYGDPEVPEGYELVIVPWDAIVAPTHGSSVQDPLFTSKGGLKAMFAVIQALFAIVTLYQAREIRSPYSDRHLSVLP
jgi:hypothetical protein